MIKEIKILNDLKHPNIVKLNEVFEGDCSFYLVQEFIPGDTLRSFMKQKRYSNPEIIEIIRVYCKLHLKKNIYIKSKF